jgi:undecaprenyl-diphosphatase
VDLLLLLKALILGIVEGVTEFLPVSSTGHLILAGALLDFNDERGKLFEIVIQSGAILAVCWEFRAKIMQVLLVACRVTVAHSVCAQCAGRFLPLAIIGLLFGKAIKASLFNPPVVATAFIVGGLIILWAERREHRIRVESVDDLSPGDAFMLGCAQALALIPGTSRSGATIIGGLLFGLSRRAATEFSFFLAIPTLIGATIYQLYKERALLALDDLGMWVVGFVAALSRRSGRCAGCCATSARTISRSSPGTASLSASSFLLTWHYGTVSWSQRLRWRPAHHLPAWFLLVAGIVEGPIARPKR